MLKIVNYFGSQHYSSKKTADIFTIPADNPGKGNYLVQISDGNLFRSDIDHIVFNNGKPKWNKLWERTS